MIQSKPDKSNRRKVTSIEIGEQLDNPIKFADGPKDYVYYIPKLYRSLALPSYVHGYSLAIELMKDWFLSKFPNNYFKVVHINGKHVLDDWKHFNNYNIKRENPMCAIIPTVDYDYDNENIDMYLADADMLLRRSKFQQSFLKDYKNNIFLYMQPRSLRMNFTFKVRTNSRSEQLDLFNRMELWFRVGSTQQRNVSADFHIPYDIMSSVAADAGFTLNADKKIKDEDILEFLNYCNKHSDIPIIYKMRAINQKPEFFMRLNNLYAHISNKEKLSLDDGDRVGKLDTNFQIEMQCILTMPIPHFFVYFDQIAKSDGVIPIRDNATDGIGIYSINAFEVPPYDSNEWGNVVVTEYLCDKGETETDLSPILTGKGSVCDVLRYTVKNGINPTTFMNVMTFTTEDKERIVPSYMDYNTNILHFSKPMDNESIIIAIYADKLYINNTLNMIEKYDDSRIKDIPLQPNDKR